ncbi:hypothetical protein Ancab_028030 [Ancistrocladus abbreviatus]
MAATVSSVWAKPGAWAQDSEEHEDELKQEIHDSQPNLTPEPPSSDFPSLATAAATKTGKKKKGQTLSLADFATYAAAPPSQQSRRLTHDELLVLPTGPRQRTAEELDRTRLGGGFRNYGGGYGSDSGNSRARASERGGYNENSNRERDLSLSRADEVDDWSKTKKSIGGGNGFERRDKVGFFNSSRADESDNWASNKSFSPSEGRRERRMGMGFDSFSNGGGADSDNWGKKKEEREKEGFEGRRFDRSGSGFDRERKGGGFESSGAADSEHWGRKKEERENGSGGRPRLNLQPRTLPVTNGQQHQGGVTEPKPKGANPFGEARPREEVLAEKGKNWKEIDEKLEAMKVKEVGFGEKVEGVVDGQGLWRRGFGIGRTDSGDDRSGKSWRKEDSNDVRPLRFVDDAVLFEFVKS